MCAYNSFITTTWNLIPTFLVCSIIGIVYAQDNNSNNALKYYYDSPLIRFRREPPIYFTSSPNSYRGNSGTSFSSYNAQPRTGYASQSQKSQKSQARSSYRPIKTFYGPPSRMKYGPPSPSYKIPSSSYGPAKGIGYGGKGGKGAEGGGGAGGLLGGLGGIGDAVNQKKTLKTALINGIKAIKGGILAMKGKFLKTKGNIIAAKGSLLEGFGQGIAGGGGGGGYGKSSGGLAGFGEIGATLFSQISNLFTTLTSTFGQIFNLNALGGLVGGFMEILGSFGRIGKLMVGEDKSPDELKKLKNSNNGNKESSSSSIIATVMSSLSQSIDDMVEIMKGLNETSPKTASGKAPPNNKIKNNGIKMSSADWEDVVSEIMKDSPIPIEEVEPESENYVNSGPGYSSGISESGSGYMNNDMITSTTARDTQDRDNNNNNHNHNDDDFNDILNMLEVLKENDDENPITVKELGLDIPKFRRIPNDEESDSESNKDSKTSTSTTSTTTSTTTTEKPFSKTLSVEKPKFPNESKSNTYVNTTLIKDIFLDYFKRREEEKKQNEKKEEINSTTSTSSAPSTTTTAEDEFSKRRLYIIIINNQTKSGVEQAVDTPLVVANSTQA